ncbi:MAG TPA: hypothetical protein VK071_08925 [Tissierellales bacterium]|nr:hypothetical protein [Tissierellales bacterium]
MYNELMLSETMATFAGLVVATSAIVQFTKPIIKKIFPDGVVRIYSFIISLILTLVFAKTGFGLQGILLALINSILVTMSAMGVYETVSDPKAQKK